MDVQQRLELLADASQYDLACACGTNDRDRRHRTAGDRWLYPVSLPRGGYSVMLKTLMSNACENDCKYCPFRRGVDTRRTTLDAEEMARVFLSYVRRHGLIGLFLSSGVTGTPDASMDRMIATAEILRRKHKYKGYIHLKVLPGVSDSAIEAAARVASALSVNVESPTRSRFRRLSDRKHYDEDILRPLKTIARLTGKGNRFARVKQTTQFIVGASDETDRELVAATFGLYRRLGLQRVYFSAYQRGLGAADIPGESEAADEEPGAILTREHRLYQADFLLRQYKWNEGDILFGTGDRLDLSRDPKQVWADAHPEFYPVDLNHARRADLLRVPGVGPATAKQILAVRKDRRLRSLRDAGMKGKRLTLAQAYVAA